MKVLVAAASKHGSTRGIANAIADELRTMGFVAHAREIDETTDLDRGDAFIIGSAVYMGSWISEAHDFVDRHQGQLKGKPVWLFSSGPLGPDEETESAVPRHIDELIEKTGALEHRVFAGTLDKSDLSFGERMVARVVKAPEGNFRDWDAIRDWAREIGEEIGAPALRA